MAMDQKKEITEYIGQDKRLGQARRLGQKAAGWGGQQALNYVTDPTFYRHITRAYAEARIAFITRWFWLAEIITLGLFILLGLIDLLLWLNLHTFLAFATLFPTALAFGLWRLARYLRHLLYRQITRALAAFDDLLERGAAKLGDWPRFFRLWRRSRGHSV